MKYLITGHRGDIGSILLEFFKKEKIKIEPLNLNTDTSADIILHLAAKSPPANYEQIMESNICLLKKVINFAEKNNIKYLIFFSAMSIYGNINQENINENSPLHTPDLYGASKYIVEKILEESSLNVICLRFPAILGKRNKRNVISRIYYSLLKGDNLLIFNANKKFNNFISVKNIFYFITYLNFKKKFDILNLACQKRWTLLEIAEFLKKKVNSNSKIELSNEQKNFFNISTEKAEIEYGFLPFSPEETLIDWLENILEIRCE